MAPSISTRSVAKYKLKNTKTQAVTSQVSNSPKNCSLIEIKNCSPNDNNDSTQNTHYSNEELVVDLRNKLAKTEYDLAEWRDKYQTLEQRFITLSQENKLYSTQIQEHKNTIQILSNTIRNTTVSHAETQTEYISTHGPSQTVHVQHEPVTTASLSRNTEQNVNRRITLLSDSHGRNLGPIIKNTFTDNLTRIDSIFKPNATFSQVVDNVNKLTTDFTKNDAVVIMAGTNDSNLAFFETSVKNIMEICAKTNLFLCTIPYRYDKPILNNLIFEMNKLLYDLSSIYNFKVIDLNIFLKPADYTKYGLHLNICGKYKIGDVIAQFLNNLLNFQSITGKPQIK